MFITLAVLTPTLLATPPIDYPDTPRGEVVDTWHGIDVPDPYRWLEGDVREHEDVSNWVDAQNEMTFAHLHAIPERAAIRQRLEELWNYPKSSTPTKVGGVYYFTRNDGLQNQAVWYAADTLDAEPRVLLDPNTWSDDGTVAISGSSFSRDGRYLAYAVSEGGSDWKTWKIRDLVSGKDLPESIEWSKFSGAAWMPDGSGFYYARYDKAAEGEALQAANENQSLWFHRTNTPQSEDVLIHRDQSQPHWGWSPIVSDDGRWLIVHVWRGGDENQIMVQDLSRTGSTLEPLIDDFEDEWSFVGNQGGVLLFRTSNDAPLGRLMSINMDASSVDQAWQVLIPESKDTLRGVSHVGGKLAASWMHDASSRLSVHDMSGRHLQNITLPGIGAASGLSGWPDDPETFYNYTSYISPPQIFRHDLADETSVLWQAAEVDFDPRLFTVKQVFYESRDGTIVPMSIAHRKDLERTGELPTLLYGYGGFSIPLMPYFSASRLAWMEMGGVLAVANLRGGGEYGRAWHEAGTKLEKQNVFDDFISAAEWLIRNGYTNPDKLAIQGGSNGGLLVGAAMSQRPDLFAAALPAVGVMDMLRYPQFTIGRAWIPDFGDPDVPEEFAALYAYSPYHNLKPGTTYPATLITTADTDDRVVPGHSFKFAAALQYVQSTDAEAPPVLIRIDRKAGHGAGKPTSMRIDEVADTWAFLVDALEVSAKPKGPHRVTAH
ncbi:MAG: prolyl oligopeptidase family serine peptidase [Phycisphaerales bacterium]|jgi:prolyl oligopeptidase|nr:prolyl oligopeptidase family serine peptidase [Phycisphaerales bacterium]